jgi:hypothetical protein
MKESRRLVLPRSSCLAIIECLFARMLLRAFTSKIITTLTRKARMRWVGHIARMEKIHLHKTLVGKPTGMRPRAGIRIIQKTA